MAARRATSGWWALAVVAVSAVAVAAVLVNRGAALPAAPGEPAASSGPHACPTPRAPRGGRSVAVDDADVVVMGGRTYEPLGQSGWRPAVGEVVGTTVCRTADAGDPYYRLWDLDATFLAAGTPLRQVPGFDPGLRLAAVTPGGPVLYEARFPAPGSRTGEQVFPGVGPHVVALAGLAAEDGTERRRLTDPGAVRALVDELLAAPVTLDRRDLSGTPLGSIALVLDDGTTVQRQYFPEGVLGPGVTVPPAFRTAAEQLLRG